MDKRNILYEDNHLFIYNKQPGDLVQGDKTKDEPLSESIKLYLKETYRKPGDVFLGVVHRIDRPVSGAVIFAKTSKALSRLNLMLKNGTLHKTYWAVIGKPTPSLEGKLSDYLIRKEKLNKTFVVDRQVDGAQQAELYYRNILRSDRFFLLEIILLTGRHHQIRAQLSHLGCPIKGDLKYGYPRSNNDGSIFLHARKLEFTHPIRQNQVVIIADPPEDTLWNYFLKASQ